MTDVPQQPGPVPGPQAAMMQPPPGYGAMLLTLQGSVLTATPNSPTPRIDGYPVPGAYGMTFYPLRPGRHRIDVDMQWLRRYGQAGMEVDIHPGQVVPVFYAPPWHQFTTGRIGHHEQPRTGLVTMLVLVLGILFGTLACCVGLSLVATL